MSKFNNFSISEPNSKSFFQTPKVFYTNEALFTLSWVAVAFYVYLRNKVCWSIKVGNHDEQGVFVQCKQIDAMKILRVGSKSTISKIYKELEEVGLIHRVRHGGGIADTIYVRDCESPCDHNGAPASAPALKNSKFKNCTQLGTDSKPSEVLELYPDAPYTINNKTNQIYTPSIKQPSADGVTEQKNKEALKSEVLEELWTAGSLPESYLSDQAKMNQAVDCMFLDSGSRSFAISGKGHGIDAPSQHFEALFRLALKELLSDKTKKHYVYDLLVSKLEIYYAQPHFMNVFWVAKDKYDSSACHRLIKYPKAYLKTCIISALEEGLVGYVVG